MPWTKAYAARALRRGRDLCLALPEATERRSHGAPPKLIAARDAAAP